LAESESKLGRFGGETAARVQRFADVFDHGQQSLTILCHNRPAWCHRARRRRYHAFTLTSAATLSSHGFRGWEHAPMKQSEARILIIQQWDQWISARPLDSGGPTGKDSLKFFHELQDTRSPLLDFQARGQDKWRIIHAWLLGAERLSDHWMMPAPRIIPTRRPRSARSKTGAKT
jgi:hypothetical protein